MYIERCRGVGIHYCGVVHVQRLRFVEPYVHGGVSHVVHNIIYPAHVSQVVVTRQVLPSKLVCLSGLAHSLLEQFVEELQSE